MTQIAGRRFPLWGSFFLLAMILGAGLVLSGCGDDDAATTPAPAPAPPPAPAPEPEPEPAPEPEPEPMPDPVMVMFSVPDGENPMVADAGTDMRTAMAMVNRKMMVTSNTTAVVQPLFVEGAVAVAILPGENTPFTLMKWSVLQSVVLSQGASFAVVRTTVGANQEMIPTEDIAYVTCGPFACADGMEPPEISLADSPMCSGWDPTVTAVVGVVDPLGRDTDTATPGMEVPAGVDVGLMYTSSIGFTATHEFQGFSEKGGSHSKGMDKALARTQVNGPGGGRPVFDADGCDPVLYGDSANQFPLPANCFRIALGQGADYFAGHSLKLAPSGADVSWGEIAWETLEDLTCDSVSVSVADQLDICSLFEEEVSRLGDAKPVYQLTHPSGIENVDQDNRYLTRIGGISLEIETDQARWTALYYDTADIPGAAAGAGSDTGTADLYSSISGETEGLLNGGGLDDVAAPWIPLHDEDGDPMYGDLGKVDATSRSTNGSEWAQRSTDNNAAPTARNLPYAGDGLPDNYTGNDDVRCSAADGGESSTKRVYAPGTAWATELDLGTGTLCDAMVDIESSVTFVDGLDLGCSVERFYTVSCEWSSLGRLNRRPNQNSPISIMEQQRGSLEYAPDSLDNFIECTVS